MNDTVLWRPLHKEDCPVWSFSKGGCSSNGVSRLGQVHLIQFASIRHAVDNTSEIACSAPRLEQRTQATTLAQRMTQTSGTFLNKGETCLGSFLCS